MKTRVLVAYDGTEGAQAALRDLLRAGLGNGVQAHVISIADVWLPPEDAQDPEGKPVDRQHATAALAQAKETAQTGVRQLHGLFPEWNISPVAKADSPAWGIVAEAREWKANLIVIGSHGRTPLERFFLGSVSTKVAAEASCSVRVVRSLRRKEHDDPRIVVALDGSPDSEGTLQEVLKRAWRPSTRFALVSVGDPKTSIPTNELLERHAATLRDRGYSAETHLFDGEPKTAILRHAESWDADCIFMGARGLQHGKRLYLGTVATAVVSRAHCTVEIVRPSTSG